MTIRLIASLASWAVARTPVAERITGPVLLIGSLLLSDFDIVNTICRLICGFSKEFDVVSNGFENAVFGGSYRFTT